MDNFNPRLTYIFVFCIGLLSMPGYLWLHTCAGARIAHCQNGNGKPEQEPAVVVE